MEKAIRRESEEKKGEVERTIERGGQRERDRERGTEREG